MGTTSQQTAKAALKEKFSFLVISDATVVRRIDCTNPPCGWSQHSWGNALDIYATPGQLDNVAAWLTSNAEALKLKVLIWRERNHYDHIHVDFWPTGEGTPPGAGGTLQLREGSGASINIDGENYSAGDIVRGDLVTDSAIVGPPPINSALFEMTPDEAGSLGCATALRLGEELVGAGAQDWLDPDVRAAFKERIISCGSRPTWLQGLDTFIQTPGDATGMVVDAALGPIDEFVALLSKGETWIRIGQFVGGGALVIVALVVLSKELGIKIPTPVTR